MRQYSNYQIAGRETDRLNSKKGEKAGFQDLDQISWQLLIDLGIILPEDEGNFIISRLAIVLQTTYIYIKGIGNEK